MAKSPDAFRTISEVSATLETPPHVLRFWESKFPQVKPVKRAGGRRYYRPDDITLLGGIKVLLHEQGMTIRGVQKMLREQGVRHVSGLAPPSLAPGWAEGGEDGGPLDGVIVGPWLSHAANRDLLDEGEEDQEDTADLAAEDGIGEDGAGEVEPEDDRAALAGEGADVLAEEHASEAVAAATGGLMEADERRPAAEAASIIESFLAGTMARLAADGEPSSRMDGPPQPGPLTLARALDLARRADPAKLRARGPRIAPLLERLRTLRSELLGAATDR